MTVGELLAYFQGANPLDEVVVYPDGTFPGVTQEIVRIESEPTCTGSREDEHIHYLLMGA